MLAILRLTQITFTLDCSRREAGVIASPKESQPHDSDPASSTLGGSPHGDPPRGINHFRHRRTVHRRRPRHRTRPPVRDPGLHHGRNGTPPADPSLRRRDQQPPPELGGPLRLEVPSLRGHVRHRAGRGAERRRCRRRRTDDGPDRGSPPERIYLHGNAKSDQEIQMALEAGIRAIIVDNFDDLDRIEKLAAKPQKVLLRMIPGNHPGHPASQVTGGNDSKFGLPRPTSPGPLPASRHTPCSSSRESTSTSAPRCSKPSRSPRPCARWPSSAPSPPTTSAAGWA